MEGGLQGICNQVAYYASDSSRDVYGTVTWSSPVSFLCYHKRQVNLVSGPNGEIWVTSHTLYTEAPIEENWLVWLPGSDQTDSSEGLRPKSVIIQRDEYGNIHHRKVIL